jgi:hypothetical protein
MSHVSTAAGPVNASDLLDDLQDVEADVAAALHAIETASVDNVGDATQTALILLELATTALGEIDDQT